MRVDLPPGLSVNPRALPTCSMAAFEANTCPANTEVGTTELTLFVGVDVPLPGTVYNLETPIGVPLEFGVTVSLAPLGSPASVHTLLEGGVSWHKEAEPEEEGIASGDYHEFFKIRVHRSLAEGEAPLVSSRLIFNGIVREGIADQPERPGPQTTHLWLEPYVGAPGRTHHFHDLREQKTAASSRSSRRSRSPRTTSSPTSPTA